MTRKAAPTKRRPVATPDRLAYWYVPDAYSLDTARVMGRQSAGNALLRAAIMHRLAGEPLTLYGDGPSSAATVQAEVVKHDPSTPIAWIDRDRLDQLADIGTLYLADPALAHAATLRLRQGCSAYSLIGVTHTLASHGSMDLLARLPAAPVMPWDALICTSTSAADVVQRTLDAELDYLHWRFGGRTRPLLPQLPVIPLGVHSSDFTGLATQRQVARAALGLTDDEVVFLFVGRLSVHAKAHPHAMYHGLEQASRRTGRQVTLLQCGWSFNATIEQAFRSGADTFCPNVRSVFTDSRDDKARLQSWAAADVFISLADSLQETFGLTPLEAMATGLPVVVSDWNGYRDTVRDGDDGFRIPVWMPPPGTGADLAQLYQTNAINYDRYCALTGQTVSVDMATLVDRLCALIDDPALRRRLGAAGQRRVLDTFDWQVIYRRYRALCTELAALRAEAASSAALRKLVEQAPALAPARGDPFTRFEGYATHQVGPDTVVQLTPPGASADPSTLASHSLFSYATALLPPPARLEALLARLRQGPAPAGELAEVVAAAPFTLFRELATLAKLGVIRLLPPG